LRHTIGKFFANLNRRFAMTIEADFMILGPVNEITHQVVDIIGSSDDHEGVLLIVDCGLMRNEMLSTLKIIAAVNLTHEALKNESIGKLEIVGAASNRGRTISIINPFKEELMKFHDLRKSSHNYPKLSKLLKVPIPAQCLKAGKNVRTR
jgi:hypothetical protein